MIRLALIGCGDEAVDYAAIVGRLRHSRFTAVSCPQLERAQQAAQQLGASRVMSSFDELLDNYASEFDAMVIHSAAQIREPLCRRAAEVGKHMLVSLPLALSIGAVEQLLKACEQANVRLMVGQTARFLPSVRTVKQSLDSRKLGDPGLLRIHRWEPFSPDDAGQHRHVPEYGEGAASTHMLQDIDLAIWLFGELPTNIYAVTRQLTHTPLTHTQLGQHDYAHVHLGFRGGGMALLDFTHGLPVGDAYFSLSLIGSTGAAYADDHHNMQLLMSGGSPVALKTTHGKLLVLTQLQEFVDAIREDRESAVPGIAGRDAALVAEAADRSSHSATALSLRGDRYELV